MLSAFQIIVKRLNRSAAGVRSRGSLSLAARGRRRWCRRRWCGLRLLRRRLRLRLCSLGWWRISHGRTLVGVGITTVEGHADDEDNCGDNGDDAPRHSVETVAYHPVAIVI